MTPYSYFMEMDGPSRGLGLRRGGREMKRIADLGEVTVGHLYQVALGKRRASKRLATVIERESGGKVSYAEVLPDEEELPYEVDQN
jgi:hypothetical protein